MPDRVFVVRAALALAIVAPLLAGAVRAAPRADAQTPAVERVSPATQNVSLAQASFPVDITVEDVTNLGGYEVLLTFDSAQVAFVSAIDGPFLGSTMRPVLCAAPVVQTLPGTLRKLQFGCGTLGPPPPAGPSGAGVLATIAFQPLATGVAALALEPSLTDPFGNPIFAIAVGGEATISPGPTPTPTFTATPTLTPTPCPGGVCPTPTPVPCAPTNVRVAQPLAGSPNVVLDVPVTIENVCDLGAFQFTLTFDPAALTFSSIAPGSFLGSKGRMVQCTGPQTTSSSVHLACVTLGAPSGGAGHNVVGPARRAGPHPRGGRHPLQRLRWLRDDRRVPHVRHRHAHAYTDAHTNAEPDA